MKKLSTYAPYLIGSAAILAAVYLLWYKPKRDAEAAKNAVLQAEEDAKLQTNDPRYADVQKAGQAVNVNTHSAIAAAFNPN
jgi:hypothetical protein